MPMRVLGTLYECKTFYIMFFPVILTIVLRNLRQNANLIDEETHLEK